ncbi:MAG: DUF29 domain-containing protein [Drouetiella hepatica Uher 2000/2452]|jgi:hypothetical protein|uniref:DUF29 domain-containing protein n=1 Tax=Drouetiella hepatica Uher 2000/2452 TaxID=904376 RepID=A0A951ULA9_9CYAN|nr:DUF29 domain-containing protein [Drouetiella hepatica Uher 2000/2452]
MYDTYDKDFYRWTREQSLFLGNRDWESLDVEHLIEEIASLGKQQERELESRLRILLAHLLKWQFQPDRQSNSWRATIREQRSAIARHLQENPSLKPYLPKAFTLGFEYGLDLAVRETNLSYDTFPSECPYSLEQVLDSSFLP